MIANIIKWVVSFTAAYRELKEAYDYMQDVVRRMNGTVGELSLECAHKDVEVETLKQQLQEREEHLTVLIDRLEMIIESGKDSTNGTARKLARVAQSAIVEVTEKPEEITAEAA